MPVKEYTGPIILDETSVLRWVVVDEEGNTTFMQEEFYTLPPIPLTMSNLGTGTTLDSAPLIGILQGENLLTNHELDYCSLFEVDETGEIVFKLYVQPLLTTSVLSLATLIGKLQGSNLVTESFLSDSRLYDYVAPIVIDFEDGLAHGFTCYNGGVVSTTNYNPVAGIGTKGYASSTQGRLSFRADMNIGKAKAVVYFNSSYSGNNLTLNGQIAGVLPLKTWITLTWDIVAPGNYELSFPQYASGNIIIDSFSFPDVPPPPLPAFSLTTSSSLTLAALPLAGRRYSFESNSLAPWSGANWGIGSTATDGIKSALKSNLTVNTPLEYTTTMYAGMVSFNYYQSTLVNPASVTVSGTTLAGDPFTASQTGVSVGSSWRTLEMFNIPSGTYTVSIYANGSITFVDDIYLPFSIPEILYTQGMSQSSSLALANLMVVVPINAQNLSTDTTLGLLTLTKVPDIISQNLSTNTTLGTLSLFKVPDIFSLDLYTDTELISSAPIYNPPILALDMLTDSYMESPYVDRADILRPKAMVSLFDYGTYLEDAELIGIITVQSILSTSSLSNAPLVGILKIIPVAKITWTMYSAGIYMAGSIRAPTGEYQTCRFATGERVQFKRYVDNKWQ